MAGIGEVFSTLSNVARLLPLRFAKPLQDDDTASMGQMLESNATRFGSRPMITFEGQQLTWGEFNALTNRFAHVLKARGIGKGDAVSLLMENRIEQLASILAIEKLGAIAGLINTNLRGRQLAHCITVTESKACIVGAELCAAVEEVKADLELAEGSGYFHVADAGTPDAGSAPNWAIDMTAEATSASSDNPPDTATVKAGDTCLYIFTSGTTGLPKAAVMSHKRYVGNANLFGKLGFQAKPTDRMYICLPLYHGTGLALGVGTCLATGASMFLRRRFSASNFLAEVREHNTNLFVYIGEICRYLLNQPGGPVDANNPIRAMVGNGLRPDVWKPFKQRFGVQRVCEFYGASEGNAGFVNLLNKDETVGMTIFDVALIEYDVDNDVIVRDAGGRCVRAAPGSPGLLVSRINETARFEGYTNAEATEKKIERNVFADGDAWFNSGDLLRTVDVGFAMGFTHYQFVDRVGDTFRWKSENVSTNEVGEIINGHPQVQVCNVYGVEIPGADGRAGMAAVILGEGETVDINSLSAHIIGSLPAYARPVFLRLQPEMVFTGTFKLVKGDLRKEAYNIDVINDPVYVLKPKADVYVPLDADYLAVIRNGQAGF